MDVVRLLSDVAQDVSRVCLTWEDSSFDWRVCQHWKCGRGSLVWILRAPRNDAAGYHCSDSSFFNPRNTRFLSSDRLARTQGLALGRCAITHIWPGGDRN